MHVNRCKLSVQTSWPLYLNQLGEWPQIFRLPKISLIVYRNTFSKKFRREALSSWVWSICNKSEGTMASGISSAPPSLFGVSNGFSAAPTSADLSIALAPTWCTKPSILSHLVRSCGARCTSSHPSYQCVFTSAKLSNTYTRCVQGLIYLVNRCQCHTSHAILVRLPSRHLVSTCAHCSLQWSPRFGGPTDDSATIHHISSVPFIANKRRPACLDANFYIFIFEKNHGTRHLYPRLRTVETRSSTTGRLFLAIEIGGQKRWLKRRHRPLVL